MSEVIPSTLLYRLVEQWLSDQITVIGPRRIKDRQVLYAPLQQPGELLLNGFLRPSNSIKEFLFPRHEPLYAYRFRGKEIELREAENGSARQIILAARPCDAAALPILDPLFNWDFRDSFYISRRQSTTVVTLACTSHDAFCFCTSVGLGPGSERGSDAMLLPLTDGQFEIRCFSQEARTLFAGAGQSSSQVAELPPGPDRKFDVARVGAFLAKNFDSPFWQENTLRCLGCGACAYTCPTCHCFDIVDEGNANGGIRARNWDSCQFPLFTLHASGHNPRGSQPTRQRQRLLHKFHIYPEKFREILCTGCGNCTRNCPVGLGVQSVLECACQGDDS